MVTALQTNNAQNAIQIGLQTSIVRGDTNKLGTQMWFWILGQVQPNIHTLCFCILKYLQNIPKSSKITSEAPPKWCIWDISSFLGLPINFLHCPCPLFKNGLNSNPYMSTWIRILVLLEWAPPVSLQQNFPRSFSVMAPILKILLCHWCQQRNAQEIEKKMSTHSSEGRRGIEEPTKMFSPSLQQILTAKIIS